MQHRFRHAFKITRCHAAASIVWCVATAASADDDILRAVEDLPPPPGFSEDASGGLAFDTAGGHIVEAYVHGGVSEGQVFRFYRKTLPQLCRIAESQGQFRRNGERLRLDMTRGADGVTIHYSLSPQ